MTYKIIPDTADKIKWVEYSLDGVYYEMGTGRTGCATMTQSAKPFKVNPLYSGDEVDNFVTRAIEPTLREISAIVRKELS